MENNQLAPVPVGALSQKPLTPKQEKFCVEFIKDFNATAAARRSGYSLKMAHSIGGENTKKPLVKSRIAELIKEASMQPEEIKKRFSDIARGDLSDYIKVKHVEHRPKVKKGLEELIQDIKKQIDFEDNYALEVSFDEDELEAHNRAQKFRRRTAIRYKLELAENPAAFRIVDGTPELLETPELDIVALARDKSQGAIKSFKMGKNGPEVELYAADTALSNLARVYALFIDRSQVEIEDKLNKFDHNQLDKMMELVIKATENPNLNLDEYYLEI